MLVQLAVGLVEEKIGIQHDILAHLPHFGHTERKFVDPVVEVGPERPARDRRFEVFVGRSYQPDVDRNFTVTAHGTDAALLQGPQQLHLGFIGKVPHLVQKERAAAGRFEGARLIADSPRERPLDMAEKLRSSQVARNGAAIDRYERLSGTLALAVDQLRHMLLARAAGTVHQYRHVRRRDEPHIFVELPRGIALPLDIVGYIPARSPGSLRRLFRRYRGDIAHGRRGIERLADLFQQFVGIDGLGDVVAGAEFHAAHGVLDLGIARHHDHGHFDPLPRHPLQKGDSVLVGQPHIAQHERVASFRKSRPGCRRTGCGLCPEPFFREPGLEHQAEGDVVVYDQNPFHIHDKDTFFCASAIIARIFSAAVRTSRPNVSVRGPSQFSAVRSAAATCTAPSIVKIGAILCATAFSAAASPSSNARSSRAQLVAPCSAKDSRIPRAAAVSSPA